VLDSAVKPPDPNAVALGQLLPIMVSHSSHCFRYWR
jgi:hypothetical protein